MSIIRHTRSEARARDRRLAQVSLRRKYEGAVAMPWRLSPANPANRRTPATLRRALVLAAAHRRRTATRSEQ